MAPPRLATWVGRSGEHEGAVQLGERGPRADAVQQALEALAPIPLNPAFDLDPRLARGGVETLAASSSSNLLRAPNNSVFNASAELLFTTRHRAYVSAARKSCSP
jgi:hypothetical protein